MDLKLSKSQLLTKKTLHIDGSKSESNRLLLLEALFGCQIENLSKCDDSIAMGKGLKTSEKVVDVGHAGTAMRFLTAYFSILEGREVVLTGSERMKQRPIRILVEALCSLGADIQYVENEGFPPLKITGKTLLANEVSLRGDVSSQYLSALVLIGAKLDKGLKIKIIGKCTSLPYLKMTLSLLENIGIKTHFQNNIITIFPVKSIENQTISVESDWSSASYFYSFLALSEVGSELKLYHYKCNSLQGDSIVADLYKNFGVTTEFLLDSIVIKKESEASVTHLDFDFTNCPDIAQTLVVSCLGLGISCHFTGLHTLKIKETDRLLALKTEIEKLGTSVFITDNSLQMQPKPLQPNVVITTYDDHRMAMAFAPLSLKTNIVINDAEVVSKSYPNFWNDCEKIGISIEKI